MSPRNTCLLINTLRLAIVAALWVIGKLVGQWEMDLWTMVVFGFIYIYIRADCSCPCEDDEDDDGEES
jgi:hypothetical protein